MNFVKLKTFGLLNQILHSDNKLSFKITNKILQKLIPFNTSHRLRVSKKNINEVCSILPFIKRNKNHLGSIHACGISTVGEFSAGILMILNFPIESYRPILKKLNLDYHKQAYSELKSVSSITKIECDKFKQLLESEGCIDIPIVSAIHDKNGQHIATAYSLWQIKKWNQVKTE